MHISWYLDLRARFVERGEWALVAEVDDALRRLGYVETAVVDGLERAVPVKRKPGRPRKIVEDSNAR